MKQSKCFILREIANTPYLFPFGQMLSDHARGIKLNATGVYIWKLLENDLTMEELLTLASRYYNIKKEDFPAFEADIRQFIHRLTTMGFIEHSAFPLPPENTSGIQLAIGNLHITLKGDSEAFPEEFKPFCIPCDTVDQTIYIKPGAPSLHKNGHVLLRSEELIVMETPTEYILLLPASQHISEIHLDKSGKSAVIFCLPPYTEDFRYDLFHAIRLLYLYLAQKQGMVAIHSASLLYQDKVWIFSGRSGMGKSTHTNLWNTLYHIPILNGDLNLLALDNDRAMVYGIPWCGTSGISTTQSYPLGGIVLLNRSDTNFVEELPLDSQILLTSQRLISPCWSVDLLDQNLSVVEEIAKQIPICKLHCTKEPLAAQVMKSYIDNLPV